MIAREQRNLLESERAGRQARSVSLHEAGFIQYLDSGIWHLAFYNDGKNMEQVSFNTIVIGKNGLRGTFSRLQPEHGRIETQFIFINTLWFPGVQAGG